MKKFNIPKGTQDLNSYEINKRNFLIKIIKKKFTLFGYSPIETPSFENKSTLYGKYGEESENLMFDIFNSGTFLKQTKKYSLIKFIEKYNNKVNNNSFKNKLVNIFSNKTLRYDLTVPFIRYIYMYKNQICFPFKRYQIQPVWRAENPQKGRLREFYQCDVDIASKLYSLWEEIELIQLCDEIFKELNIPIIIYINHISILKGLLEISGIKKILWKDFIISLDKYNKIGKKLVIKEIIKKGISLKYFENINFILDRELHFSDKKNILKKKLKFSKYGYDGIKDISFIYNMIKNISLKNTKLIWDLSLARGINYYTNIIWEIVPFYKNKKNFLSIGGGGRYNKLPSLFGMKNIYSVGCSLGLDRIYYFMDKNNLFNNIIINNLQILFINFGDEESLYAYKIIKILRDNKISSYLYPNNNTKISKQFKYASKNNIPFVIIIGKKEIQKKIIKVKYILNKTEKKYKNINDFIKTFK